MAHFIGDDCPGRHLDQVAVMENRIRELEAINASEGGLVQEMAKQHVLITDELSARIEDRDRSIVSLTSILAAANQHIRSSHDLMLQTAEALTVLQAENAQLVDYVKVIGAVRDLPGQEKSLSSRVAR